MESEGRSRSSGDFVRAERHSAADRYLVGVCTVGAAALVVGIAAAGSALLDPLVLLFVAAFALTAPTPLVSRLRGDTTALTVDEMFLVPAFVLLPPAAVVVAAGVGMGLGLLIGARWPAPWIQRRYFVPRRVAFNAAEHTAAVAVAAVIVQASGAQRGELIAAAVLGAVAYAFASWLLVAGMIARVSDRRTVDAASDSGVSFALVSLLAIGGGVLLALAVRNLPAPPAWIAGAAVLVIGGSAVSTRAVRQSDRLRALLDAAAELSDAGADLAEVTEVIESSTRRLLDCRVASLTHDAPIRDQLAVELTPGTWLHVAEPRTSYTQTFEAADRASLRALASMAAPALARAGTLSELRSADDLKAAVLASVSHDVRTPLAVASGTAELLADHPELPEEQRRALFGNLRTAIDRVSGLVEGLLDLERYELGHLPEPADAAVAAVVARMVGTADPDTGPGVRVEAPQPVGAPIRARIDAPALERVVDNLVSNALKHSPPDEPVVVRYGVDGACVRLTVDDAGPGVPPEQRAEIFEPFHHGDLPGSVGLGLWVARRFVELRGGRLWVDESERGGATFHVELPTA